MKKNNFLKTILTLGLSTFLVACGNLSNVTPEGTTDNPVFPKIEKQTFNHDGTQTGLWVNWNNVRQIEKGMNKDQLYYLIGRPHHGEGLYGVREWDYTFNYNEYVNGEKVFKQCQYKILFDKHMNAQEFYWHPNGCNGYSTFKLEGDFLFDFDKDTLTQEGKQVVREIADKLQGTNPEQVQVDGHTDRFGSDAYNQDLSERRATRVANELLSLGVDTQYIVKGYGKTQPVKFCDGNDQAAKDCLRPNRRVEIKTMGKTMTNETEHKVPGKIGPTPLYDLTYPKAPVRQ